MKSLKRLSILFASLVAVLSFSVATAGAANAPCRPVEKVDASKYVKDGRLDLEAYLAALGAANAAASANCGSTLPATGSDSTDMAAVGFGLAFVGLGAVGASKVHARRKSSIIAS